MSANQYQHELQSMTVIVNFRREAIRAEQCRIARAGRPNRSILNSLVSSARRGIFRDQPLRAELIDVPFNRALMN